MSEFLPDDYEPPKQADNYLKLTQEFTKIRILSQPIIGWEEWENNRPIRYKRNEKPQHSKDPKRPLKEFWSFIIWNYNESKIQIFHCTKASILMSLGKLCKDPDWGSPFYYDIRITKTGQDAGTKYIVMPLNSTDCSSKIIQEFNSKPCLLEMMFENKDPFAQWKSFTPGCFGTIENDCISENQYKELMDIFSQDLEYFLKINENIKKNFGVSDLKKLPINMFEALLNTAKLHIQEKNDKKLSEVELVDF